MDVPPGKHPHGHRGTCDSGIPRAIIRAFGPRSVGWIVQTPEWKLDKQVPGKNHKEGVRLSCPPKRNAWPNVAKRTCPAVPPDRISPPRESVWTSASPKVQIYQPKASLVSFRSSAIMGTKESPARPIYDPRLLEQYVKRADHCQTGILGVSADVPRDYDVGSVFPTEPQENASVALDF